MITETLAIVAALLAVIFLSLQLVERYAWARRASPVMLIIFLAALLSNVGIIPTEAPIYGALIGFAVPFAVCVILFTVDLGDVVKAGRPMLMAFLLAAIGSAAGVLLATVLLAPFLGDVLGESAWKIAGPYTGTYIGGSLNFFAMWTGLEIDNPDLLAAANAVDNLTLFPLYALWMFLPTVLAGRWIVARRWAVASEGDHAHAASDDRPSLIPTHVATIAALAVAIMAVSQWLKTSLIDSLMPGLPSIVIVTTLALIVAQSRWVRQLQGARQMGDMAFYLFFAAVGALINFYQAVVLSPVLFAYVIIVMAVHFAFLYTMGWLLKMDIGVLTIASVATKAGPALVPPIAESKDWHHLLLPGIVLGMLGYAVGNYAGLAVAHAARMLIGG
ncbi:MAG: DUF819 family protein [Xanthomonadales bacterium]|nr:DUF819 family protein [Xanthomonadales bacterium]